MIHISVSDDKFYCEQSYEDETNWKKIQLPHDWNITIQKEISVVTTQTIRGIPYQIMIFCRRFYLVGCGLSW
jgi:hypothetical protein